MDAENSAAPVSLADEVIKELQARKGEWREIAVRNEVSYSWIEKCARGEIPNPGIRTIERIHRNLRPDKYEPKAAAA